MKISDQSRYVITLMKIILYIKHSHEGVLLNDLQHYPNITENQ